MESTPKVGYSKTSVAGPVDLQLILSPSVNIKIKLELIQKIYDVLQDCCKIQQYFDTMVFVFVKLLTTTEPSFTLEQDQFKMRLLITEILHRICNDTHNKDKLKCHIQNLMRTCLKVIDSDNEQCVVLCIFIYRDLLTIFQPKFDGFFKLELINFFKLILEIYKNSSTPDKIFLKHKSSDLKVLIKTVRYSTVIRTNNTDSFNLIPMGKISFKVIKELSGILKLYYVLYHEVRPFVKDILDFVPVLMNFFNLDIPYKPDYRDLVIELKHAQAKLLSFFSIILRDHKDKIYIHCSPLPGRLISLLSCNTSSDDSSLRLELLSGLEYVILSDYKCEFLPYMDKFIDETLITGRNWSLKQTLRPRAYIYIDHLTTNLRSQLSMNFLMRVIHLYFSNILDCTLQPETQLNLLNMVMNVLSYVIKKQNQLITNINTFAKNKNPILDLFYRVLQIFIRKLKQFQNFYLPQLDWSSLSQDEVKESMTSILKEYQSDRNREFMYGYHSSQIQVYTVYDSKRFIKIVVPAIRTIFQFIVKIEGTRFTIELHFNKLLNKFLKHSLLSLKLCNCPNQKKDMVKEILTALSCVNPIHLKICIARKYDIIKLIYAESLETLIFDMALNDEVLVLTFSSLMFEFILNNLVNEIEQKCIVDLVHRLQLNFKLSTSDEVANEYIYKIIKTLMNNLQNTNHVMFNIEVLKTIFAIVESAQYELEENMNSLLKHLFNDLLSFHYSLPNSLVLTKIALSELCLAECLLQVVPHNQIIDLFPIIAYSLQTAEIIPQGLSVLEKCVAILPGNFFNDLDINVRNEILIGLYYCLDNPSESMSQSVVSLLGKFGGLNRSLLKPYQLNLKTEYHQNDRKPKILISFQHFDHNLIELDIEPSINTAVEILMSNYDRFNRVHSWNVIKGFLVVSLDCDTSGITNILSNINWETSIDIFANNYIHYVKTSIDETCIKALTGLMICCNDEYLKTDAIQYFNEFTKLIVHISICHFSSILHDYSSKINPYTLIDAIIIVLSQEKEIISSFGVIAIELVMKELNIILGCKMVHFPLIAYMVRQCCELCYDINWVHKRGGCFGLNILFSILLKEGTITENFSNWFIQHFLFIFKAMVFIFSDLNEQLTFGALEIAKNNLDVMINWLYLTNPNESSHDLIKETILKDIADNIIGPNDLLRELSIKMVTYIADKQQKSVSDILIPYHEHFNLTIPGYRLFNTYTYQSQMGIMKGHIFCMLFSIPLKELDFSKKEHVYYFNFLYMICKKNDEQIKKIPMFMGYISKSLYEYRKTAIQVLANCISFFKYNKKKVLKLFLNMLTNSDDHKLQEMAYQCLKLHTHETILMEMVDKLFIYYIDLYGDYSKVTLINTRCIVHLSKLFPSHPSIILSSILLKTFKYLWSNKYNCKNRQSNYELENILKNILEIMSLIKVTQFFQVQEICEIILNADILFYSDLCNQLNPFLIKCLSNFPEDCVKLFFKDINIKNSIWTSFFNSMIRNEKYESLRIKLKSSPSLLENLLLLSKIDPSRTIQYECIRMIYNMAQMDKKWIIATKLINTLLNIWSDIQYKDRYKNLAAIKLTEWDEPKMLLKIVLIYFKNNVDKTFILFQMLSAFSSRFPIDINFFRQFVENEIIKSYSIKWIQTILFKFVDLYQSNSVNGDLLGRILQYLILPSFSLCYKNGDKEKLLYSLTNPDENIIGTILNKIFGNIRTALTGCDFDGIKVFLCQLLCLLFHDLMNFNEAISRVIHNAILNCKSAKCILDLNVQYHCNLILIFLMLSGKTPKSEKHYQAIYDELLKCSSLEALPVIQYSLGLIVTAALEKRIEVNTLIACVKNSIMSESHNFHTLHHILFFIKKYNTLFYPYKEDMSPLILKSLLPVAKNNNMADYKKTAMELACLIVDWDLDNANANMEITYPLKTNGGQLECNNSSSQLKKSSAHIEDALNFLAKVACQTYDDKHDSKISRLAKHSDIFFKNILSTKPLDTKDVKLKLKWIEKVLETFLKKENLSKQNPNLNGNTNSNVLSLVAIFEMISFLLKVLSQKFMLEVISSLQDYLIQFLQLVFNEVLSNNQNPQNPKEILTNRLSVSQVKQCNEGTLKVITDILKAFPSIDGLEKLHTSIQTIIVEGLNSNCLHKLDVSLTLLNASLLYFSNYMDSEIVNTIGDILFKFNENNSNPSIKVKSLEILKTHVDTLPRNGKQVFIEKVVIENLNKARDSENNIPFEVQVKCFELIITYIKDIPEATEGIILNSTLLEYIKTTTDERIMTIILNVISKWIDICRDESVLFNCQIINILKCITIINRFPRLSDYCYTLNLEIFKNWYFHECIEFGLNCKSSPIRYNFLHFLDTLWTDAGLCMRLSTIMSDDFSYDLQNSLAFYIQLLFVKITRNTKLQGDFPILRNLGVTNETLVCSENYNFLEFYPVNGILTFDICSSLAQLCFVNVNLAKIIWTSILPSVWGMFNDEQKKLLSQKAVNFLVNSKLNKSSMAAFYEAIILCLPKIKFEPHQMVYIGKTYSLWYKVIQQLEEICDCFQQENQNEAVEGLIQMYSLLREEDILESLFQKTIKCEETKKALSLEQQGCYKKASTKYIELLNCKINELEDNHTNCFNKEIEFRKIHLTKCLRELNDWNYLSEHLLEDNCVLNIEYTWKKSIGKTSNNNLRWDLEHKQQIWPSKSIWKYHFYLAMFGLNELDHQVMSIVQEHIVLAIKEIVDKWKALPKYLCNAHIPLLQATQLIVEIQEAHDYQKGLLQSPENINNICLLNENWNNRKPWIGDNLNVWNDLISWRKTYYSFLIPRNLNTKILNIKSAVDQSNLMFGKIALKHNLIGVCLNTLQNLNPENVNTSNWLYKMFLEAKCIQKIRKYKEYSYIPKTCFLLNKDFKDDMKPLLFLIKGIFYDYGASRDTAFHYFAKGFFNGTSTRNPNDVIEWKCVIHNYDTYFSSIYDRSDDNCVITTLNNTEILKNAWIQWATSIEHYLIKSTAKDIKIVLAAMRCYIIASELTNNKKNNILIAKILLLLTYDDKNCTLLHNLENCNITYSDLWLPQILNIFVEKTETVIEKIILKIRKLYPQKMYLILYRMFLSEEHNQTTKMEPPFNYNKYGVQNVNYKVKIIKKMMNLLQKYNFDTIQLDYFINEINALDESWDEELRRQLYECLYLSYDYAFENKNLNVRVPREITNFIKTIIISFVAQDVNMDKFKKKRTFLVPDNLSQYYQFLKEKFSLDFSFNSVPTIKLMVNQLRKWIHYLEQKSVYPSKIIHSLRCPTILNIDWTVIMLPSDNYINDSSKAVRIHNLGGYIYLKDKSGTVVKQLSIRGTDGLIYTYHISKGKSIDSEERIFQLFHIANSYLQDFKETAKRFLKFSIPRTFTVTPYLRMVENSSSMISLVEIYEKITKSQLIGEDIDFWFSVLNTCIITERSNPLKEAFLVTSMKYGSDKVLKNWVLSRYPLHSDYYTFRKTFVEHYTLLCFFEHAFNLIKLKPEMLNIDENNGTAIALYYKFSISEVHGDLFQSHVIPFRVTPNIASFITPYRKHQLVNIFTTTGQCLTDSLNDISAALKLLLKDEFSKKETNMLPKDQHIDEVVNRNLSYVMKNFDKIKHHSTNNPLPDLLLQALNTDLLCHEYPTWRPWL